MKASKVGVGAVLARRGEDENVHPIQYASRTMTRAERNHEACKREVLAVIFALPRFRVYLFFTEPLTLISNHKSLSGAFKMKDLHGRLARQLDFLSYHEFTVQYKPVKDNIPSDFLSRHDNDPATYEARDEG